MLIYLNADWRVRSDPLQWILEQRPETEKAQAVDRWQNVGYFHTLAQAVQEAAQRTIRLMPGTCGPETLEALLSAISGLAQDITNALAGIDDAELRRAS